MTNPKNHPIEGVKRGDIYSGERPLVVMLARGDDLREFTKQISQRYAAGFRNDEQG